MLHEMTIINFRNIERLHFSPGAGLNFILGDNGAGKSSLLESVEFLSRGRTFRSRLGRVLVREGALRLAVSATLGNGTRISASREISPSGGLVAQETRMNGQVATAQAEIAAALPVVVFHPGMRKQAQGEARYWRSVLDWGVFHVKPAFRVAWGSYRRALRQRNALLRDARAESDTMRHWNGQMAEQAGILDAERGEYAGQLVAEVEAKASEQGVPLRIVYFRGWAPGEDFRDLLEKEEARDRRVGYTRHGPHRASLLVLWEEAPAGERASGGQQKSIAMLLLLAQAGLFTRLTGRTCIVMIDDLAAEFDERRRDWLLGELEHIGQQVFVTATDGLTGFGGARRFHMKHGGLG